MSLVSFVKIKQRNQKEAIENALGLINYSFPVNAKNIVIKPNMCYYWDKTTGQTTDPRFIGALIEIIRTKLSPNVNISLVESDASAMKCRYAFKFLGFEQLAKEYGVRLVNLAEEKADSVQVTAGGQTFHFMNPRIIQNADLKINVTKIKYSLDSVKITCALKNLYGCNPYPKKFKFHSKLNETIVALNKVMKFDLCLLDGNVVVGRQVSRLGLVMASEDPVAMDSAAAKIAGVNPNSVNYIQIAQKEGVGRSSFVPRGESINYFINRYPRKDARKKLMGKAYNLVLLLKLGKRLGIG
jgi:uncharacterized protein (DUF362 family)